MYPYVMIGDVLISMTGLGLVISYLVFLWVMFRGCKQHGLNFLTFFLSQPLLIFLVYVLGRAFAVGVEVISNSSFHLSFSGESVLAFLVPVDFQFHYIGVIFGIVVYLYLFISKKTSQRHLQERLSLFYIAFATCLIPLGMFFLLGDNIIGKPTASLRGVHRFTEATELLKYGKVYPLGLLISFTGALSLFISKFIDKKTKRKNGLIGFSILVLFLSFTILYQKYPRHGVMKLLSVTVDIKQYFSRLLVIILLLLHNKHQTKR